MTKEELDEFLHEFISVNGLKMHRGKLFAWEKAPLYYDTPIPWNFYMTLGDMIEHYEIFYMKDTKLLHIGRLKLKCKNLDEAEEILMKFIEGNNLEIPPLYKLPT